MDARLSSAGAASTGNDRRFRRNVNTSRARPRRQAYPRRRVHRLLRPATPCPRERLCRRLRRRRLTRLERRQDPCATDVLDMDISLQGGQLTRADLLQISTSQEAAAASRFACSTMRRQSRYIVLQSGLTSDGNGGRPDHLATYDGAGIGVRARQRAARAKDSAHLDATTPASRSPRPILSGAAITPFTSTTRSTTRAAPLERRFVCADSAPAAQGRALDVQRRELRVCRPRGLRRYALQKLKIDDEEDRSLNVTVTDGWLASMQHHFVAAACPPRSSRISFASRSRARSICSVPSGHAERSRLGGKAAFGETVFVGPKLQAQLEHGRATTRTGG